MSIGFPELKRMTQIAIGREQEKLRLRASAIPGYLELVGRIMIDQSRLFIIEDLPETDVYKLYDLENKK